MRWKNWLEERPTANGYYWIRNTNITRCDTIIDIDVEHEYIGFHTDEFGASFDEVTHGEWYGPLTAPLSNEDVA